ncbi:MAG TPA: Hsp20/alpha crystallin family protein [Polyangiaceae bacterium]|nr:Hsp20/alpha crystallin family protein [Polyangiaceae bacterium]
MEKALFKQENGEVEPTREEAGVRVSPAVDIFENADGFLVLADLPGVEASGLTLEFNPPELRVSGRQSETSGAERVTFERRFELGSGIDPESIQANLSRGVLRIELKKSAALRPRRIDVRAA